MTPDLREVLRGARAVVVVTHVDPDPDAIGSLLAMGELLDALSVPHELVCNDLIPHDARFLPGVERIVRQPQSSPDVVVFLDCGEPRRAGPIANRYLGALVVNIDHHASNTMFGDFLRVDPSAIATTQIVHRLAGEWGLSLSPQLATYLLTGLYADTQGLRIPATKAREFRDAAMLADAGANPGQVAQGVFGSRPVGHLALWAGALGRAVVDRGLVWATIPLVLRREAGVPETDDAGIVNFLLAAEGTMAAAVISERTEERVGVSLRSTPRVDVSEVARYFGGGGHQQAAGCTVVGELEPVAQQVVERLRRAIDDRLRRAGAD